MKKTIQLISLSIAFVSSNAALAVNDGGTGGQTIIKTLDWLQWLANWLSF